MNITTNCIQCGIDFNGNSRAKYCGAKCKDKAKYNRARARAKLPKRGLVCGVGINDSGYRVRRKTKGGVNWICPFYQVWAGMLSRCYSHKFKLKHPTYEGCSVSDDWLTFSNFKSWMEKQDWLGMDLDKDIIKPYNKIYSKENCAFIDRPLNRILLDRGSLKGDFATGVSMDKRSGRFVAQISINGKQAHLGYFLTEAEAYSVTGLGRLKF